VDGVIETWDTKTGDLLNSFQEGDNLLTFAVAPEEIAAGAEGKIIILDAHAENKILEIPVPGKNAFLAFNADGSMLASANSSGQIQLWKEQEDGLFQLQTTLTREQPFSLAFSPQSNLLAVGTTNHVYLINADTGEEEARIPNKGIVYSVSISSDGKTLATASLKMIQLWDIDEVLKNSKIDDLQSAACSRLFKNFSKTEWEVLFGNDQSKVLCENLPSPE
jgi:WD40 repeat protein